MAWLIIANRFLLVQLKSGRDYGCWLRLGYKDVKSGSKVIILRAKHPSAKSVKEYQRVRNLYYIYIHINVIDFLDTYIANLGAKRPFHKSCIRKIVL